ncbi:sensor domain-containing diguanylate cyclase [Herbaspirillum hiltneri]|uniref:sensor domain-containing diguanylate cyclase n=1 Tax=Herbaspirillum hiltneri TaxID=341045 RepID=UPI00069CE7BE|nr:GGDEF domain-containing protein [Herbaspirillum hiltneri]
MPHRKQIHVIFLAKALVVLACALLVVLAVVTDWRARKQQLQEAGATSHNIALALARHADDTFKQADTTLIFLAERLRHDERKPASLRELEVFLAQQTVELPQLHGLFVIDKDGKWLLNSRQYQAGHVNSRDREYYLYHRQHEDLSPHISMPVQSRANGEWVVTISRRLNGADGSFDGVVMAAIRLAYFSKFYENFDIGEGGAVILAGNEGTLLVRRPLRNDSIGKSLAQAAIFRDHAAINASGSARIRSSQDGVIRINSYRHLDRYPLFVAAALSEQEVLASWRSDVLLHVSGLIVLLSLLVWLGGRLIRQIELRVEAENAANHAREHVEFLNRTLQNLATQDGLTGLGNRRCFDEEMVRALRRCAREGKPLALIMLDVDFFKRYNDTYGHLAGDECLRKLSQAIRQGQKREGDLAARYGGEELVLMLPDCDGGNAVAIAEETLARIRALQLPHQGNPNGIVTVSAGVAVLDPVSEDDVAESLIGQADKALYLAKSTGRDRVCTSGASTGAAQLMPA